MLSNFKYRNQKILDHAKGQECQMRLPKTCNHDPDTTVPAHSNSSLDGKGLHTKAHDCFVSFSCFNCHSAYDGNLKTDLSKKEIEEYFYRGMRRTWLILLRDGVLK